VRPRDFDNIHVVYLKHADAKEIVKSLSKVVEKAVQKKGVAKDQAEPLQITADESTNSLIITASPEDYQIIKDMIEKLDIVREQVLVELQIVEASEDALKEIGIELATLDQATNRVRPFGLTHFGLRTQLAANDLEGLALGVFKRVGQDTQFAAVFKAMERHSGVKILSTPHVLTSNHREATILIADNVPFVKESRVTEADPSTPTAIRTFDFKDVGISLKITPHVSAEGMVRLEIDSSFGKLIEGSTGLGAETPTTDKREVKTEVSIKSGETVVIGGLMRDDKQKIERKVPILADLPLIGNLFRLKRDTVQKTNLLLFITPRVMKGKEELAAITKEKTEESRVEEEKKRKKKGWRMLLRKKKLRRVETERSPSIEEAPRE